MDELYIEARRVLLDGIQALREHRESLILVGAQAVYLRVGDSDLAVAPYTTDGDLALDPGKLKEIPPLEASLIAAGFSPQSKQSVGIWVTTRTVGDQTVSISIDLLVPEAASRNADSRAADLVGHDRKAARNVQGLDGALVDHDKLTIKALDPSDTRELELAVAGPAALLVAKLHKISDRLKGDGKRLSDKDALDVVRLLRGTQTNDLAVRYRAVMNDPRAKTAGERAVALLKEQFVDRNGVAGSMIERAVGRLADPVELIESARALGDDLLQAVA